MDRQVVGTSLIAVLHGVNGVARGEVEGVGTASNAKCWDVFSCNGELSLIETDYMNRRRRSPHSILRLSFAALPASRSSAYGGTVTQLCFQVVS